MTKTQPEPPEEQLSHVVLPVHLPDLGGIKNADIKALRDRIYLEGRKARKEATKIIYKEPKLRDIWMITLGTAPEEVKVKARADFERGVLRHPEVFLKHAWANALASLNNALLGEMLERSKPELIGGVPEM